MIPRHLSFFFFFFNDTATTEIYTLSLHDALPISDREGSFELARQDLGAHDALTGAHPVLVALHGVDLARSEEHTSELQSQSNLVCRLLLEKKKIKHIPMISVTEIFCYLRHSYSST